MVSGVKSEGGNDGLKKVNVKDDQHHHSSSPLHSQYEEELERIRTEGDLALIKAQSERKKLLEIEAKLAEVNKQLKERKTKKQGDKGTTGSAGIAKSSLASLVLLELGSAKGAGKQLPVLSQSIKEHDNVGAKRSSLKPATNERLMQTEGRLKVAAGERTAELQKLRYEIDETRRKRLNALAAEKEMLKDIREADEDITRAQAAITQLKSLAADLKSDIAGADQEFDTEKQAYRLERQRLLVELEEITKSEKQGLPDSSAPVVHLSKSSVFHNIARRKKNVRSSKWKRVSMEQKIVSFEQKKLLLDRVVEETNVKNMSEFIQKYNDQERIKAEVFARIEVQTATNASLNESIAQLTEDIGRLSGAGDSSGVDEPSELQELLDTDDAHIKRWMKDADIFTEAVKTLRGPIFDLYKEFFPDERAEDVLESTTSRELGTMRRIGAIEERIMQFVMAKILEETGPASTPNNSDTLKRLRQYQGRREQRESANLSLSKFGGVDPPSTLKVGKSPRKNAKAVVDDDDDDDIDEVAVMHSDVFRQKFSGISATDHNGNSNAIASASGPGVSGSPRKNAFMTTNI